MKTQTKPCTRCKIRKTMDSFYIKNENEDNRSNKCIDCAKEISTRSHNKKKEMGKQEDICNWNDTAIYC